MSVGRLGLPKLHVITDHRSFLTGARDIIAGHTGRGFRDYI